jgi:transposase-like protein
MTATRKRYSSELKAKVALEAIKDQKTLTERSNQFQLHPNQITRWRKQLLAEAHNIFSIKPNNSQRKQQELESQLYQQIGELAVELNWLKKKLKL